MLDTEQLLTLPAGTPGRLAALTDGIPPEQLRAAPLPGEWSAVEVLAHLCACADMWGRAIEAIGAQERPTLRAVNPRYWIKQTDYPRLEFEPSLRAFAEQRSDLLALLRGLPPEGWARTATVTGAGKTLERSVWFYAQWPAQHERPHLKQIARIANGLRASR